MEKMSYLAKEIMAPSHERWNEFLDKMFIRFVGCDEDYTTTQSVLQEIPGVDVDRTLDFFLSQEGFCDCQVLSQVVAGNLPRDHQQILIDGWIEEVQRKERLRRKRSPGSRGKPREG
jgi:hypothetical protein